MASIRRLVLVGIQFLFVMLLLGSGVTVEAAGSRVVRVAFFPMEGFNEYSEDGSYTGMDVDYLDALNEFADWDIQYVDCDSWDDALRMLSSGEADLVGSAQYSIERANLYCYARFPSGYTYGAIMTDSDSDCAYEDFETMKDLTYGVVETYIRKEEFLEYLSEHGIDHPNIREYSDSAQLRAAQERGEVDAIVHTYMEMGEDQQIIGRFAPSPFYYISDLNNTELMEELNEAVSELLMKNPLLEDTLMSKYYSSKLRQSQALTKSEKSYVEELDTLTVGYVDGYYPFSYEQSGEFCGLSRQVFDTLQTNTGISISYRKAKDMEEALEWLEQGKIDVLSYCSESRETLRQNQLIQASVYASADPDKLSDTDQWTEKAIESVLQEHDIAAVVRSDASEQLEGVLDKELGYVDETIINEYVRMHPQTTKFVIREWVDEHETLFAALLIAVLIFILAIVLRLLFDSRKMQQLLYKDTELGIWNQNYLTYAGKRLMDTEHKTYAVVCVNVLQFRMYNTLYGWQQGNRLLRAAAALLSEQVHSDCEICARNQGDRFVLLLSFESGDAFMERLCELQKMIENSLQENSGVHMVVCMGVCYLESGKTDIKSAIGMANQALEFLRDSKTGGIQVYDDRTDELIRKEHEKEELLEQVDVNRDFTVYYQEKVDIRTQKIVGAEALVRFVDPSGSGKVYPPGFFIPYYEKTGRVTEIDFFVLESVCRTLRDRLDAGKVVLPISCNFSRRHFEKQDFPDRLEAVLEKYEIPRDLIEVEITETIVIEEMEQKLMDALERLKAKGIRISIDDFGSGYSSLGVFEQVPASVIKLDRSFLLNRTDRVRQVKIMQQIVQLADELDTQVVCEGVEDIQDVKLMQEIGAYIAQGYYYAKPQSLRVFEERLEAQAGA